MTMSVEAADKLDRRQRKSRSALDAALLQLIAAQPYAEITVEDIVNTADVARGTFYAHYRDKDDLLAAANRRLMDDFMATVADASWQHPPAYSGAGAKLILRHVDTHRHLYRLIISGEGGQAARQVLVDTFRDTAAAVFTAAAAKQGKTPRGPIRYTTTGYVGALLFTIEDWLTGDLTGDPDDIALQFMHGHVRAVEWSMGFDPGDMTYTPAPDQRSAD